MGKKRIKMRALEQRLMRTFRKGEEKDLKPKESRKRLLQSLKSIKKGRTRKENSVRKELKKALEEDQLNLKNLREQMADLYEEKWWKEHMSSDIKKKREHEGKQKKRRAQELDEEVKGKSLEELKESINDIMRQEKELKSALEKLEKGEEPSKALGSSKGSRNFSKELINIVKEKKELEEEIDRLKETYEKTPPVDQEWKEKKK